MNEQQNGKGSTLKRGFWINTGTGDYAYRASWDYSIKRWVGELARIVSTGNRPPYKRIEAVSSTEQPSSEAVKVWALREAKRNYLRSQGERLCVHAFTDPQTGAYIGECDERADYYVSGTGWAWCAAHWGAAQEQVEIKHMISRTWHVKRDAHGQKIGIEAANFEQEEAQTLLEEAQGTLDAYINEWTGEEDTDGHADEWCLDQTVQQYTEEWRLDEAQATHLEDHLRAYLKRRGYLK